MAGPLPSERAVAQDSGVIPEATPPQVEYRVFQELSPKEVATLTGGEFEEGSNGMGPFINFPGWHIRYGGWIDYLSRKYNLVYASIKAPHLGNELNEDYPISVSVVVLKRDDPGIVMFVQPGVLEQDPDDERPLTQDWIRVVDKGLSVERAPIDSSRVTEEIRHAAQLAKDYITRIEEDYTDRINAEAEAR